MLAGVKSLLCAIGVSGSMLVGITVASAAEPGNDRSCPVNWSNLKQKLRQAANADSTGLNNDYWAVVVNREGTVCAVAYSGARIDSQWLASRQIAAAKAFTANGLSLDGEPISTGALYSFVLPIVPPDSPSPNPLYGLHGGNVLDSAAAYKGPYNRFGAANDPMEGERVGGTITFGGGLGLYKGSKAIGGLGLSGDTACADHSTAWRTRELLGLVPSEDGLGLDRITLAPDAHPDCPNSGGTEGTN
jgi:uncharacterized protein GlcG (DUF336 family)